MIEISSEIYKFIVDSETEAGLELHHQLCVSKTFSMKTENAAKPAQPTHAAFGPPRNEQ